MLLKIQFTLFRTVIPFTITITASFITIYKLFASKRRLSVENWRNMNREYQFARSLIIMDILFIIFRLPSNINLIINNSIILTYSFYYSIFALLRALHNVFAFLIFILFNRIYRELFKRIFFYKSNRVGVVNEIIFVQIPSI